MQKIDLEHLSLIAALLISGASVRALTFIRQLVPTSFSHSISGETRSPLLLRVLEARLNVESFFSS